MKHANIALFIPHVGCPHQCSFCNQRLISGAETLPDGGSVRKACGAAAEHLGNRRETAEIAFFGGSFTAIPRAYMLELLEAARDCVIRYGFGGIRCSTRPDAVDEEVLDILERYGVTAVELGCQTMDPEVLRINRRGHTPEDAVEASRRIRARGISLGHQMMVGLYGEKDGGTMKTAELLAELSPDTMRIYPTLVVRGTLLEKLWQTGEYRPLSLEEAVDTCAGLLDFFQQRGIPVIRLGLHASQSLERDRLAGPYHPAFRELCESHLYYKKVKGRLGEPGTYEVSVHPGEVSKMVGQKRENIRRFEALGYVLRVKVCKDGTVSAGEVDVKRTDNKGLARTF